MPTYAITKSERKAALDTTPGAKILSTSNKGKVRKTSEGEEETAFDWK